MSWDAYKKGQEVRFRALGGWVKGHVSEIYDNSISVAHNRGSQLCNTRIYDLRNIEPCPPNKKSPSTFQEPPSFDF